MTAARPLIPLETMPPAEVAARLHDAAVKIIYARAHAEAEREKAEARAAEIYATRESWPIERHWRGIYSDLPEYATKLEHVQYLPDSIKDQWRRLYTSAVIAEGYEVNELSNCPYARADTLLLMLQSDITQIAKEWTTIFPSLLTADEYREYIELLVQTGLAVEPTTTITQGQ